ncbi:MAG: hypothetical protein WDO69_00010 [Pseudomonadota bacterium]
MPRTILAYPPRGGFSGLVYDVGTGKLDIVEPPALLHSEMAS